MLFALGAGKAVVGDTSFCNYPAEARKKPKVGDVTTNIEAVVALKPDLVLAHKTMNAQAAARLEKLGQRVFCLAPESFAQLREQMDLLGRVLKREEEARSWRRRFDARVKALQKRVVGKRKVTCALVVQVNPLWVAGRECFLDEIIRLAGGVNVCAQEVRVSAPLDGERLVALNPRVVLGVNPANGDLRRGFWKQLGAVKERSVYDVPADLISRPGPRMIEAAERVAGILEKYRS
jgi:iron complex transport system substrate-binding protein